MQVFSHNFIDPKDPMELSVNFKYRQHNMLERERYSRTFVENLFSLLMHPSYAHSPAEPVYITRRPSKSQNVKTAKKENQQQDDNYIYCMEIATQGNTSCTYVFNCNEFVKFATHSFDPRNHTFIVSTVRTAHKTINSTEYS